MEIRLTFANEERVIFILYVVFVDGKCRATATEFYRRCPDHRISLRNIISLVNGYIPRVNAACGQLQFGEEHTIALQ